MGGRAFEPGARWQNACISTTLCIPSNTEARAPMGVLTIRNVDDEVIARLKARAKANHRSLEGELRHILSRHAVPNLEYGLMRERARAAYGPSPAVRDDTPDSLAETTDSRPDPEAEPVEWLGAMRDMGEITGDIISPVSELSDWDVYRSDAISGDDDGEAP